MADKNLVKTYNDKKYVATTTVRHEGCTVAFAMDADRRIYYSVLYLDQLDREKGDLDAAFWNTDPGLLPFPGELADVASALPRPWSIPSVKKGGAEVPADRLFPGESDVFLSSTARLTASAPIQVVSDGQYILVFRQSIGTAHSDAVFEVADGGLSGAAGADYVLTGSAKKPLVDSSLLCDRFVLVGSELKPVLEVRYQRSRSKLEPASGGDTLGTRDMEGRQFYEPTQKLSFVRKVTKGSFAVLLLPTAVHGIVRWQIFVADDEASRIDSFSLEQSSDGLFDVGGTQLWTSPDPVFASAVLERVPGVDPHTGLALVPVVAATDRAGAALRFDAKGGHVRLAAAPGGEPDNTGFTVEAWIRPTAAGGIIVETDTGKRPGFRLGLDAQGHLVAAPGDAAWKVTSTATVPLNACSHVAVAFDGTTATLFLNGAEAGSAAVSAVPEVLTGGTLGARYTAGKAAEGFAGDLDEVRVWAKARGAGDMVDRGRRLSGVEPDLTAYYRLDEGQGTTLTNHISAKGPGTITGAVEWVGSQAPVGDGPGLARDTFAVTGRKVVSGLAAALYYQQESGLTGYGTQTTREKRQARVLLACATSGPPPEGGVEGRSYLATIDFAVSADGRLAMATPGLTLKAIGVPDPTKTMSELSAAQTAVSAARDKLEADKIKAGHLPATLSMIRWIVEEIGEGRAGSLHEMNKYFWHFRPNERAYEDQLRVILSIHRVALGDYQAAEQRLSADQAALTAAQNKLAILSGGQQGADEMVLEMPVLSTDRAGLSVFGALLTFAWTADAPALLDSATGDVIMYFRGGDGQFFSAYYAASVSRAVKTVTVTDGTLQLISRDTAVQAADIGVQVSAGSAAGRCTVVITRGTTKETFTAVPREAGDFAAVLNGERRPGTLLGTVSSAQNTIVELAVPLAAALSAGTAVSIGGRIRTVADGAQAGSTKFSVTTDGLASTAGDEVHTALYDYAQATTSVPGASLDAGSQIVGADAGLAVAQVGDGAAKNGPVALVPRWRGATPGRALSFDGKTQCLHSGGLPDKKVEQVGTPGDLTVEAWAKPGPLSGLSRIVCAGATGSRYSLGLQGGGSIAVNSCKIVAEVNGQFVRSTQDHPVSEWTHLAMSFQQSWGLRFGGEVYLDCGGPEGLDLVDDLTIEVGVKLDRIGAVQGLVSKGVIGAATPGAVPYSLYVEADGQLAFTCETGSGEQGRQTFLSGVKLQAGVFTKVAVTRKSGMSVGRSFIGILFYVDGKRERGGKLFTGDAGNDDPFASVPPPYHLFNGAKPVGNDAAVEVGRHRVGATSYGLDGTLSEVRIWRVARDADQIGAAVSANASGLAAWWTFPEAAGSITADACGSYPATLRGAVRARTPDPRGNRFALYRNGTAIDSEYVSASELTAVTSTQLSIATRMDGSELREYFSGALDEIRIWRVARSHEQILDNLFSRIRGERPDLIVYYPLEAASTAPRGTVYDSGLAGVDLKASTSPPDVVLSTAPISEDTSLVRSALSGVKTPFNILIGATPAASEYADVQRLTGGQIIGVMKRAYTYVRDDQWVLTTGFKIGDLSTTWVGQAQFDPQLIGYIEGAPPVPSENMTPEGGSDFAEKSSVTFVQADNVANTLASKKNISVTMAAKAMFNWVINAEVNTVTAPLGVGTAQPAAKIKSELELTAELKYGNGWDNETQVQQTSATTRTSGATLTGGWENSDPAKQANPAAGQRWIPHNTGFAIVTSETADVYALRLTHSGALVAYRMLPSPDIPRDWNILSFPINPRYTKQGTLDGIIGYGKTGTGTDLQPFCDPDYPKAATGLDGGGRREFSYFRPTEAYAVKKRIQREQQQLQGFYDSVSTETHTPDPTHGQAAKVISGMMGGTGAPATAEGDAARGPGRDQVRLPPQHRQHVRVDRRRRILFRDPRRPRPGHRDHRRELQRQRRGVLQGPVQLRGLRRGIQGRLRGQTRRRQHRHPYQDQAVHPDVQTRRRLPAQPPAAEDERHHAGLRLGRQARPGARPRRRLPVHDLLPRHHHRQLRGLLRQGHRPRMARAQQGLRRPTAAGRPPSRPQTPLLADHASRHLRQPRAAHHPRARRLSSGEGPSCPEPRQHPHPDHPARTPPARRHRPPSPNSPPPPRPPSRHVSPHSLRTRPISPPSWPRTTTSSEPPSPWSCRRRSNPSARSPPNRPPPDRSPSPRERPSPCGTPPRRTPSATRTGSASIPPTEPPTRTLSPGSGPVAPAAPSRWPPPP